MDALTSLSNLLAAWAADLATPGFEIQLGVVAVAALAAWGVHRVLGRLLLRRTSGQGRRALQRLTLRGVHRLIFPFVMLVVVLVGRGVLVGMGRPVVVLDVAVPLLVSLAGVRLLVYMLRKGFPPSPALKAWEGGIATTVWLIVALHLVGWLPAVLHTLDALGLRIGTVRISVLSVIKLVLLVAVLITVALWLAGAIERRVMKSAHLSAGMQVGAAKFSKFLLITLAVLLALNAVGIDLTAFAVFGGALGVGLGFGLQRIASNFISGFIVILDRSIRPGDVITVGDKFGWVQELRARYVVVRNRDGVDTLIPNENLVTSEVINWSYGDRNVRIRIPVQISYRDDPEQAMAIMVDAARRCPRVLADPAPACRLLEFGDNGIGLELRVWINDPEQGINSVRSEVNLAIWRGFKDAGITIPFPQRDVHLKGGG